MSNFFLKNAEYNQSRTNFNSNYSEVIMNKKVINDNYDKKK